MRRDSLDSEQSFQLIDLSLTRNLSIMGLSIIIGLTVPTHIEKNPIHTGNKDFDEVLIF